MRGACVEREDVVQPSHVVSASPGRQRVSESIPPSEVNLRPKVSPSSNPSVIARTPWIQRPNPLPVGALSVLNKAKTKIIERYGAAVRDLTGQFETNAAISGHG